MILTQTLGLAAAQVFATALDAFFQLTIMLVILMISLILLAHYRPFEEKAAQITQVLPRAAWHNKLAYHACFACTVCSSPWKMKHMLVTFVTVSTQQMLIAGVGSCHSVCNSGWLSNVFGHKQRSKQQRLECYWGLVDDTQRSFPSCIWSFDCRAWTQTRCCICTADQRDHKDCLSMPKETFYTALKAASGRSQP